MKPLDLLLLGTRLAAFLSFLFLALSGCDTVTPQGGGSPGGTSGDLPPGLAGNTVFIDADTGGVVELSVPLGSVSLFIPPGALPSSMDISVYSRPNEVPGQIRLALRPSGLEFMQPVRLTVSLSEELLTDYALINMWHISELNDLVDAGSEEHRWAPLANVEIDEAARTISGEIEHFSAIGVRFIKDVAYLVMDIPGKYLRPGDGLWVLSETLFGNPGFNGHWFPGHNGMVNSIHPDGSFPLTVIESTVDGGPAGNIDGVQLNNFPNFKVVENHVYMGARRPRGPIFTDAERQAAVDFARSKLGEGYGPLGNPLGTGLWTCTDLVEGAWDAAGRGVVPALPLIPTNTRRAFFPAPVETFDATVPVRDITVKVGEEVRIPVYPVIIAPISNVTAGTGYYSAGNQFNTATTTVTGMPQGAVFAGNDITHPYHARTFIWTPQPSDAGSTILLDFNMAGTVTTLFGIPHTYSVTQTLDIHVGGVYKELDIQPATTGGIQTGFTQTYYFSNPPGAVMTPSMDHLYDQATGNFPTNPVFPGQIMVDFEEGPHPNLTDFYGVSFHIHWIDHDNSPPTPPGSHVWIYWNDYDVPFYTGQ